MCELFKLVLFLVCFGFASFFGFWPGGWRAARASGGQARLEGPGRLRVARTLGVVCGFTPTTLLGPRSNFERWVTGEGI